MAEFASNAKANTGVTLGAIGTGLSILNGGLGNILGGGWNNCGCSDNMAVSRYELGQESRIAKLESEIALRDANIYNEQKMNDFRNYVDAKFSNLESAINAQAVYNATNNGFVACVRKDIDELMSLTKNVIPITNVCPQPMPQYNSWTAPTTPTTAG